DRTNHASLIDAALLSRARLIRYVHRDVAALEQRLQDCSAPQKLIATDGVFSMDGDVAPLRELTQLAQRYRAWLLVDDAHGLGVLGAGGRGSLEHFGLTGDDAPVLMATLGKALGTFGAFVAGSEALIETLIQSARSYIYTTALPPVVAEATRAALRLVQEEPWRREHLQALVARFKRGAGQLGLNVLSSDTPIQPLVVGAAPRALELSQQLESHGILVGAIRPPTVPQGTARLRITLSAVHREEHVDRLLDALATVFAAGECARG
ncbi:MAG: 8-amino-7-oxononanoate synthase, partial [Pseudomonadota bacterium]